MSKYVQRKLFIFIMLEFRCQNLRERQKIHTVYFIFNFGIKNKKKIHIVNFNISSTLKLYCIKNKNRNKLLQTYFNG